MMKFRKRNMVIIVMFSFLIITIMLAFTSYSSSKRRALDTYSQQLLLLSSQMANSIQQFVNTRAMAVNLISNVIHPDNKLNIAGNLKYLYDIYGGFTVVVFCDPEGKITGCYPDKAFPGNTYIRNIAEPEVVRKILTAQKNKKLVITDGLSIQPSQFAPLIIAPAFSKNKTTAPVLEGTIIAVISLEKIKSEYINQVAPGKSGHSWLWDSKGAELAGEYSANKGINFFEIERGRNDPSLTSAISNMKNGMHGTMEYWWSDQDKGTPIKKIGAHCPVDIWGLKWTAGVSTYRSEITRTVRKNFRHTLGMIAATILVITGGLSCVFYIERQRMGAAENVRIIKTLEEKVSERTSKLEKLNKELTIMNEVKNNFLSMVSHELRTPLTTIQGYLTFILSGKAGNVSDVQEKSLKIADSQVMRLDEMISELLDVTRIESGSINLEYELVNMKGLVDSCIEWLAPIYGKKAIAVENKMEDNEKSFAQVDRKKMSRVFINLISNAVKFTSKNGKIEVSKTEAKESFIFCVSDNGIGIPGSHMDKVFDKFYQVDSSTTRKYKGSGLGLLIAKEIVELHGGKIWAESEEGTGSKFFFTVPKPVT